MKNLSQQTINHGLRAQLKINVNEYCLLLYINEKINNPKQKSFNYDEQMFFDINRKLKFTEEEQKETMRTLIAKRFFSHQKRLIVRHPQSIVPFYPNDEEFEEIWALANKWGNKVQAKKTFDNCRKEYSFEFLKSRVEKYLIHIDITGHKQQHVSTFFGPDKHFLNEFQTKKPTTENELTQKFFD